LLKTAPALESRLRQAFESSSKAEPKLDAAINLITSYLRPHLKIAEIVKAGSWGKGTADGKDADLDLVLILTDFDLRRYDSYLETAENALKNVQNIQGEPRKTRYALQFKWNSFEVDLLFGKSSQSLAEIPLEPTYTGTPTLQLLARCKTN